MSKGYDDQIREITALSGALRERMDELEGLLFAQDLFTACLLRTLPRGNEVVDAIEADLEVFPWGQGPDSTVEARARRRLVQLIGMLRRHHGSTSAHTH
ncbi:hypothetical protein ACQQ2N_01930 [Dokdonella sp. MW10]|uniref:hypothetical protein n=1 Tax=Dokdonella sp. MW10 TaxID=2992926 RepID=UPI003F821E64